MFNKPMNEATIRDWRELGFYYERDDELKAWKLAGSREGLLRFRDALRAYAAQPGNAIISEHEHYGPYMYLEVATWTEARFGEHAIQGTLADLRRLADLIDLKLQTALPGSFVTIREEFAVDSPYSLILEVQEDGFDPARADTQLWPD